MVRGWLQFGSLAVLMLGLTAHSAPAQNGERMREWQAQQEARREAAARKRANGGAAKPNDRALMGLPPKWVQRVREMPPEQQEQFLQNNEQFRQLPPERQNQIRQNLAKWNRLSPEEKDEIRRREEFLENLSPAQRQYLNDVVWPKWNQMPKDRRQVINNHLGMLSKMSPATQQAALNDPRFMAGLSPDEQSMLRELNSLRNPPTQ